MLNAIERAKALRTYRKIDRSAQYTTDDPAHIELTNSLNRAWVKIRWLQRVNWALGAIITALAWEGLKVLAGSLLR
jgi:hypothetical protein